MVFIRKINLRHFCTKNTWIKPTGYDTGIKVYNCISKEKVPLVIRDKNCVTWYTCGPTVYDSSHLGHASCYVKLDIIQRILKNHFHLNLVTLMNITDIDDKLIKRSRELKIKVQEIAKNYEKEFWEEMNMLNVTKPNLIVRVTESMGLIIEFIKKLESKGIVYKKDDSVNFYLQEYIKDNSYGKLQNIFSKEDDEKTVKDFAVWKCSQDEPSWPSPWGNGRPGWHIECSAIASYYLGSQIDFHAGGIDLRFPHHENEEAQSCAYHECPQWVNYWLHTGHLFIKDRKMSKSLKNFITIKEVLRTVEPDIFRLACLMSHYRSRMEYTEEFIKTAKNNLDNYRNFLNTIQDFNKDVLKGDINEELLFKALRNSEEEVQSSLKDDFDTPAVLNSINQLIKTCNAMIYSTPTGNSNRKLAINAVNNYLKKLFKSFGMFSKPETELDQDVDEILNICNEFRQNVRNAAIRDKNKELLEFCDFVRDSLKNCGVTIKDHGKISSWTKN